MALHSVLLWVSPRDILLTIVKRFAARGQIDLVEDSAGVEWRDLFPESQLLPGTSVELLKTA